ncbi:hypothetical protein BT69DRAFT_1278916 [Atractiella rhizophila]|nr:hypothetical protein BT69DRAFT_1278916 [Atractiella rhizophila]
MDQILAASIKSATASTSSYNTTNTNNLGTVPAREPILGPDTALISPSAQGASPTSPVVQPKAAQESSHAVASHEFPPLRNNAVANRRGIAASPFEQDGQAALRLLMEYEALKIKSPDYLPIIVTVVGMFMASGTKGQQDQYLWLWIAFLLLVIGVAWVDVSSRVHALNAAERHNAPEPTSQLVPLVVFWCFHLIVAYQFTSEHLDDQRKWVLHLLPLIIAAWTIAIVVIRQKRIRQRIFGSQQQRHQVQGRV